MDNLPTFQSNNYRLPNPLTWLELSAKKFPPKQWIVNGIIASNSITTICSESGVGKSWLALEMARCVGSAKPLFGTISTIKSKVLYLDGENGEQSLQLRCSQLGFNNENADSVHFMNSYDLNLNTTESVDALLDYIVQENIGLLIVDTFRSFSGFGMDENNSNIIRQFYQRFFKFREHGVSVVFLEHTRKGMFNEYKSSKAQVIGSQDKVASVDSVIILRKKDNNIIIDQVKQRFGKERDSIICKLEDNGPNVRLTLVKKQEQYTIAQTTKQRIKEIILSNPEVIYNVNQIRMLLEGVGRDTTYQALNELVIEGTIQKRVQPGTTKLEYFHTEL